MLKGRNICQWAAFTFCNFLHLSHAERGVFVDVGAEREGFLHVNEWGDGFPEEQKFARNVPAPCQCIMAVFYPDCTCITDHLLATQ